MKNGIGRIILQLIWIPITVDEYDAISREAVNRYYEHLKNNPSLSNEDVYANDRRYE